MLNHNRSTYAFIITLVLRLVLVGLLLEWLVSEVTMVRAEIQPLSLPSPQPAILKDGQVEYAAGHVVVKFRSAVNVSTERGRLSTGRPQLDSLLAAQGVSLMRSLFYPRGLHEAIKHAYLARIYLLELGEGRDVLDAVALFESSPEVEWAEPDYIARSASQTEARLTTTPDDPLLTGQWGLYKIQALDAWDVVTGTQTVVIAVLDSGIEQTHVDLASLLWTNPGEITSNSLDDDNNGYVDDIHGWDFVNDDNDPSDDNGHGTQVAGIAAAATNNAVGIAGVCWNCRIMPVKVMQGSGIANYSDITAGVWYAAQKGAEVINLSMGGYGNSSARRAAIQAAVNTYGAVVVGGAGNDNLNSAFYPAAYDEVLAVAGTTETDEKATLSNYGTWVDVSAPAINITTTFLGGDWGPANGTSFAASFASGLAGLLRSQHPEWTPELVKTHIEHTTDEIDSLNAAYAGKMGTGRINAEAAVSIAPHPILTLKSTEVNGDPLGRPTQGESSTLAITLSNEWLNALGTTGILTTTDPLVTIGQETASFGDIAAGGTASSTPVYTYSVALVAGYNYLIPFLLQVSANSGAYTTTMPLTNTTRSANEPVSGTMITPSGLTIKPTSLITI